MNRLLKLSADLWATLSGTGGNQTQRMFEPSPRDVVADSEMAGTRKLHTMPSCNRLNLGSHSLAPPRSTEAHVAKAPAPHELCEGENSSEQSTRRRHRTNSQISVNELGRGMDRPNRHWPGLDQLDQRGRKRRMTPCFQEVNLRKKCPRLNSNQNFPLAHKGKLRTTAEVGLCTKHCGPVRKEKYCHRQQAKLTPISAAGALIRAQRMEQGWTQLALADVAGVSRKFLIDLESGYDNAKICKTIAVLAALELFLSTTTPIPRGSQRIPESRAVTLPRNPRLTEPQWSAALAGITNYTANRLDQPAPALTTHIQPLKEAWMPAESYRTGREPMKQLTRSETPHELAAMNILIRERSLTTA
ncbi:helix-turn-helix domain-containing protein [Arthrobacter sp. HY1533]|uniref:helix-turn-helix domain-containing protein n=1 Tax=Arthrobacter sp. HY1533 TaxID=2970919 RepID=UPI0022B9E045|nr:helix-turn-helix domain-containing protein [Arthrobacter sp. HY1533]